MSKLHEILAVEGDKELAAKAVMEETTTVFTKKPSHFQGKHTAYTSLDENTADDETSTQEVVTTVEDKLIHALGVFGTAMDITVTKDCTNTTTSAEVEIGGKAVTPPLPATALLSLETRVKKCLELFRNIPTLAPARPWELDPEKGPHIYRDTAPEPRFRTKKMMQHKIIAEATPQHKAQVECWAEDVKIGKTIDTHWSSMMTPARKSTLIARAQTLLSAVKQARQRANCAEVEQKNVSNDIFSYLLAE